MRKKIIMVLVVMLAITPFTNATVSIGQIDDAQILEQEQKQCGGFWAFAFTPYVYLGYPNNITPSHEYSFIPQFENMNIPGHNFGADPLLLIPRFSLGYVSRRGLKKRKEFSLGVFLSSPVAVNFGIMGPDIAFYIGIKKNIYQSKAFNFSYKFNVGGEYTAMPGLELVIKNSLMFGSNREKRNFTLTISLQNSLGTIMPFGMVLIGGYSLFSMGYATISPEIEFSWSNHNVKGFTSNIILFFRYNFSVDIQSILGNPSTDYNYDSECWYYYPNVTGVLKVGMAFALQGRTLSRKSPSL